MLNSRSRIMRHRAAAGASDHPNGATWPAPAGNGVTIFPRSERLRETDDIAKSVQLYDLAKNEVIVEMAYYADIEFMEGDEIEIPTLGAHKIAGRRWSISRDSIILVLLLEPLI